MQELEYFASLSRVGDNQHQVVFLQYAQVAVLRFAGVEKYGRGAGRAECGGDIHGYLPRFAHSAGHEFPAFLMDLFDNKFYGFFELIGHGNVQDGLSLFV